MPAGRYGDSAGWTIACLVTAATALMAAAATHHVIISVLAGVTVAMCYPAWLFGLQVRRRRETRQEAARGIAELESWLTRQRGGGKVAPGGVPERCPICGHPSNPTTGRCLRHY